MMWKFNLLLITACLLVSCEGGTIEYTGKDGKKDEEKKDEEKKDSLVITIAHLRTLYDKNEEIIDDEYSILGRVVSSDQFGNFYKRLIIEDETGGIEIMIDMEDYHREFPTGMELKITCNSLIISEYGGMVRLGGKDGRIGMESLFSVIQKQEYDPLFAPLSLKIDEISPQYIGRWVSFNTVQFADGESWADGVLVDENGNLLRVYTDENVEFSTAKLPTGSGFIHGVLMVFNGEYQLEIVGPRISASMTRPRFEPSQNLAI